MNVYVLLSHTNDPDAEILGIYTTFDKYLEAEKKVVKFGKDNGLGFHYCSSEAFKVDAEPEMPKA